MRSTGDLIPSGPFFFIFSQEFHNMAKAKKEESDDIFTSIAAQTGGEVVGDTEKAPNYFIDTGNLAINYSCSGRFINGGVPGGKLTEIYGPSASSKSLLGTNLLFGCQKLGGISILIDSENAINKEFIKKASHADLNKIIRYTPETLEKCFHVMYRAIEKVRANKKYVDKPIVIVYDSISVSPCAREFRETDLPEDYTKEQFKKIVGGNEQPGERAKICSKELRKLNTIMEANNVSVVIMNQTRDKIGVMYGCLSYNNLVWLANGTTLPIGEIVEKKMPVKVLSYNVESGEFSTRKILEWHDNGPLAGGVFLQFIAKRPLGQGYIYLSCTPNHMLFLLGADGVVSEIEAGKVKVGDNLVQAQSVVSGDLDKFVAMPAEIIEIFIKPPGKKDIKYDLTIEGNHTYVVDGVVVHNSPETTAGGGNALPFYASLRFRTQTQKKIEQKVKGLAKKKSIGINIKIANKKNRSVRPYIEVENIPLFFERGINPIGGILGALLDADRISAFGAGNFAVKPEYANGKEDYKFKSSLERNDIPIQVLLDCPGLIDATSSEQVAEYLEPFKEAIAATDDPDVEAFDASESDDEEVDGLLG